MINGFDELVGKMVCVQIGNSPAETVTGRLVALSSFGQAIVREEDTGEDWYVWPALKITASGTD